MAVEQTSIPQPEGPTISTCSWCELRATTEIQIQPAWIVKKKHPITGEPYNFTKRAAVRVPACKLHSQIEMELPEKKIRKKVPEGQTELIPRDKETPSNAQML